MSILFFDTETTGKTEKYLPAGHARQPHIVQLAAVLATDTGDVVAQLSTIIKPDGWTVPEEAARIHGITTEECERHGIHLISALSLFANLCDRANTIVAHNLDFDSLVIAGEFIRAKIEDTASTLMPFCTMKAATPILNLPGRYGPKWPSLNETHLHFFGTPVEGAHDALADVMACMRCYFKIVEPSIVQADPNPL